MNIKFYNLGTLKETELDLQPLTVIIGPNNSNKTYVAYSVYRTWSIIQSYLERFVLWTKYEEDKEGFAEYNRNSESKRKSHQNNLDGYGDDSDEFGNGGYDREGKEWGQSKPTGGYSLSDLIVSLEKLDQEDINSTFGTFAEFFQDSGYQIFSKTDLTFSFSEQEVTELSEGLMKQPPFLLPAERNAFIINYKLLNHRRFRLLEQVRERSRKGDDFNRQFNRLRESGDTRYSKPVEDFLDFLVGLDLQPNTKIDSANKNDFQKLADTVEKHLQGNHKTVLKPTLLGGQEIRVDIKKGLSIDLYNASSSIKQLAPLLLYLRYRAKEGDLLIIDEPEMGLHPESQAKLLEVLGILVYLGVKVLITTHSPYFMSHLNNLTKGEIDNPKILKSQAKLLYLQDSRAFLSLEKVSAYEMQDNQLVSLKDEDYGIRWDNLSEVAVDLQQKRFQLYDKQPAVGVNLRG